MMEPVTQRSPLTVTFPSGERVINPASKLRDALASGWMYRVSSKLEERDEAMRVLLTKRSSKIREPSVPRTIFPETVALLVSNNEVSKGLVFS